MKTKQFILAALVAMMTLSVSAQQVTTLYFLENAPMRHTINPAFQPVSNGYLNFTPLGWSTYSLGNNTYTLGDFFMKDPNDPTKAITVLHPHAGQARTQFINSMPNMTLTQGEITLGLLNFGFRIKERGYFTIGVNERIELSNTMPKSLLSMIMGGTLDMANSNLDLDGLTAGMQAYSEFAFGYSHKINDQWSVGGKAKLLLGQAYTNINGRQLGISSTADARGMTNALNIKGDLNIDFAGPINTGYLSSMLGGQSVQQIINQFQSGGFAVDSLADFHNLPKMIVQMITPSGYGAAFDLGFAYKPIEQLQISLAVTDLGFMYWTQGTRFNANMNSTFTGIGEININDPAYQDPETGKFSISKVSEQAIEKLKQILNDIYVKDATKTSFMKMTSARLNVGVDANFWDNRVGIGVVSATRLYNSHLYEEVTFGAAFRPVNWFNIAASYSILNNGKYSNVGAAFGFMPYDGINLTLAMDYIPTSYAAINSKNGSPMYVIPDKTKMFNVALGFSIVWGSNHPDKDHDGVWDKIDMCPNTPRGVQVDSVGCPLDEDHDGVPDYLDYCLGTPEAAIGHVDADGCPLDSDGDGVEDYRDKCPNTPEAAWGKVDSVGCPIDSDGDGVADYLDMCPETPEAAWGKVDSVGCPIDSDGDGVPDYLDECPDTPEAAWATVDERGCPIDSDGDGVPDYKDECPNTPLEAAGKVDEKGCELDSDGDGVPDYLDECPYVIGVAANKGCPEVKREVRNLLNKAMKGIEFESGKAAIKKKSYDMLDLIAEIFIENSSYIVEVQGHTDNTGKYEQNVKISQQRAEAVMNYLIEKGVPAERLSAVGYGPDVPIADNKTKAGRAKNRRVEFKISFEQISYEMVNDRVEQPAPATPAQEAAPAEQPAPAEKPAE